MVPAILKSDRGINPLDAYDYRLPTELIAQHPSHKRVQARLLVLARTEKSFLHQHCYNLPNWLNKGDCLVVNNTKVVQARIKGFKPTGGKVEVFLLNPAHPIEVKPNGSEVHEVLLGSHRKNKVGTRIRLKDDPITWAEVVEVKEKGKALIELPKNAIALADELGEVPLPPYIKRQQGPYSEDEKRYQTVYASEKGAVAAPTAGLHLSPELLQALKNRGVTIAPVTLHVGYGTFAEPSLEDLARKKLHSEWVEITEDTAEKIAKAKERGGRVIAVGTTSMRSLEWRAAGNGLVSPGKGWCDLMIDEGYPFKVADGLLTNFHLPRTTLLMLVSALAGRNRVMAAYAEAIKMKYRFYSFGDAMLII